MSLDEFGPNGIELVMQLATLLANVYRLCCKQFHNQYSLILEDRSIHLGIIQTTATKLQVGDLPHLVPRPPTQTLSCSRGEKSREAQLFNEKNKSRAILFSFPHSEKAQVDAGFIDGFLDHTYYDEDILFSVCNAASQLLGQLPWGHSYLVIIMVAQLLETRAWEIVSGDPIGWWVGDPIGWRVVFLHSIPRPPTHIISSLHSYLVFNFQ